MLAWHSPFGQIFERNGRNLARTRLSFTPGPRESYMLKYLNRKVRKCLTWSEVDQSFWPERFHFYIDSTLCKLRPFVKNAIPKLTPAKILRTLVNSIVLTEFSRFCKKIVRSKICSWTSVNEFYNKPSLPWLYLPFAIFLKSQNVFGINKIPNKM